jgi:hypothetical protein
VDQILSRFQRLHRNSRLSMSLSARENRHERSASFAPAAVINRRHMMSLNRRKLIQSTAMAAAASAAPIKLVFGQSAEFTYKLSNAFPAHQPDERAYEGRGGCHSKRKQPPSSQSTVLMIFVG